MPSDAVLALPAQAASVRAILATTPSPGRTTRRTSRSIGARLCEGGWSLLRALAECLSDRGSRGAYVELRLDLLEPLADGAKAQEQLRGDLRLVLDRCRGAKHFGVSGGEPEGPQRFWPEARDILLEQQRVRIARQQLNGEP